MVSVSSSIITVPTDRRRLVETPSARIRDTIKTLFDITPLNSAQDSGIHRTRGWDVESAIFTQVESGAFTVGRTRAQADACAHLVTIQRYDHGGLQGRIGDLNVDRDQGAIYVFDLESDVECVQRPGMMQSIILPKSDIGYDREEHPPLLGFRFDQPVGRTLDTLFRQLFDGLLKANSYRQESYKQFVAFLKLAICTEQKGGDVRRYAREALKSAICQFIEMHLDDPELSSTILLKNFGVSRASLYRIFAEFGGVRQYISDRRLMRAVLDLSGGPRRRGEITAIAEKWGFSSGANFNRAVRHQFGLPPGALVNTDASQPPYGLAGGLTPMITKRAQHGTVDDYVRGVLRSMDEILESKKLLRV